jgi:NCS1 family nucleobase:cation symporter-1
MNQELVNEDLAPVTEKQKNWTSVNFFTLWVGMSVQIPTYMMASSLIEGGMNWSTGSFYHFFRESHCAYSYDS